MQSRNKWQISLRLLLWAIALISLTFGLARYEYYGRRSFEVDFGAYGPWESFPPKSRRHFMNKVNSDSFKLEVAPPHLADHECVEIMMHCDEWGIVDDEVRWYKARMWAVGITRYERNRLDEWWDRWIEAVFVEANAQEASQ